MKGMTHEQTHIMWEKMREYKAEGHTMKEVADRFGVTEATAQMRCKGIAPQIAHPKVYKNKYTTRDFDRVENAKKYIAERTPGFEYAGNFTGVDGFVDLRCKTCGTVTRKSFVTVKHGTTTCKVCAAIEASKRAEQRRKLRQSEAEMKRWKAKASRTYKQIQMVACECCGALFVSANRTVFCSDECSKRVTNARHNDKRVKKIRSLLVDKNITLERLYERDGGVCQLCGMLCDWKDTEVRENGTIVAGNNYPSIDHIVPISRGGLHAWGNVQLAHRRCNTAKGNRTSSPCAEIISAVRHRCG